MGRLVTLDDNGSARYYDADGRKIVTVAVTQEMPIDELTRSVAVTLRDLMAAVSDGRKAYAIKYLRQLVELPQLSIEQAENAYDLYEMGAVFGAHDIYSWWHDVMGRERVAEGSES